MKLRVTMLIPIMLAIVLSSSSCGNNDDNPAPGEERLYFNGKIYTVDEEHPWAEAMLVKDGIITAIGSDESVQDLASDEAVSINLRGSMVMPGIHDVHMHPLEAASSNFQFTLNTTENDPEDYASDIEKALRQNPDVEWLLGWGFEIFTLLEANRSPIEILDDISKDKAIAVMEQSSHAMWVNSKALELAGIDNTSPDPTGGVIMKDDEGQPNGVLIDNAGNMVVDLAIASMGDSEQNDYEGLVNYALPELAKNGITSVCDARTYWKRNHHKTWLRVANEGKLTARVNLGLWIYPAEEDASQIETLKSLYLFDEESLLKINQIKLYADGIVVNTTSAMHNDFKIDLFGYATNNGLNYISPERMASYIAVLEPMGFDFHIHAIGNRGVTEALNAIEQSGSSAGRHRLTHVEYVIPADYARFAQLNVTADAQVAGDFSQPEHWHENDELVDAALNDNIIPIKSLFEADARVTLSSDWDVSDLNPFVGLQNAVSRNPQEISLEEAVKAYTINAAYVMRQEDKAGSLEVGKEADFVVLNQNIFDVATDRISKTKVQETYLQGNRVYP